MRRSKITVVGSVNMDLITTTENVPGAGETVLGESFATSPGGKGANQAVAAAKLGADVTMIGCVGDDSYGEILVRNFEQLGVDFVNREAVSASSTGMAQITVSEGENRIIVVPGANHYLSPEMVERYESVIADSDILLTQLEVPLETVEKAVELAGKHNVKVILNPAPAQDLSSELLEKVNVLTPNEHEFRRIFQNDELPNLNVVMTMGAEGAIFLRNDERFNIPGFPVRAVDTTGAGDAFNGGLAFGLGMGKPLKEACRFANAVAALAVTKTGAQGGMANLREVERFLSAH